MTTGLQPVAGKLYRCSLKHGTTRICRYGYHRKNNDHIWYDPPGDSRPSCLWYGWRDHENWRFIRGEEVLSFIEVIDAGNGSFVPASCPPMPALVAA